MPNNMIETIKSIIEKLINLRFQQLFNMENIQTPAGRHLLDVTKENIGKDLSPSQNEFGCQETVCTLLHLAFKDTYKTLSTKVFYDHVLVSNAYVRIPDVRNALAGDIILSPTGYGNGNISNGHIGIVLENGMIASNDSFTSKLSINYNLKSWSERYGVVGGFPITIWRRIQN